MQFACYSMLCVKRKAMRRALIISILVSIILVPAYQAIFFSRSLPQVDAIEMGFSDNLVDGMVVVKGLDYLISYRNPINYIHYNWSIIALGVVIGFISSALSIREKSGLHENT